MHQFCFRVADGDCVVIGPTGMLLVHPLPVGVYCVPAFCRLLQYQRYIINGVVGDSAHRRGGRGIEETGWPRRVILAGIHVCTGCIGFCWPSKARAVRRLVGKCPIQVWIGWGISSCCIVAKRRVRETLSKAPRTSIKRVDVIFFSLLASSMMWVRASTASVAVYEMRDTFMNVSRRWWGFDKYASLVAMSFFPGT